MPTIFRVPDVKKTEVNLRRDPLQARQFVAMGLALLTAVTLPRGEIAHAAGMDIAPPKKLFDSPIARDRQRINDLSRSTFVQGPRGKTVGMDLPRPWRFPYIDKSWIETNDLCRQLATILPRGKVAGTMDLPVQPPRYRIPPVLYRTVFVSPVVVFPESLTEWPLPQRPLRPIDRSWIETNDLPRQLARTLPRSPTEWPLPQKAGQTRATVIYRSFAPPAAAPRPFALLDWPLPAKGRPVPPVYAFSESLSLTAKPFAFLGWTLPLRKDSPLARDRQRINDLARQTAVTLPARPLNWPLSARARPTPETIYGSGPKFMVASQVVTIAATDTPDTASLSLSFWQVEPIPPDSWTPETPNADTWTKNTATSTSWTPEIVSSDTWTPETSSGSWTKRNG